MWVESLQMFVRCYRCDAAARGDRRSAGDDGYRHPHFRSGLLAARGDESASRSLRDYNSVAVRHTLRVDRCTLCLFLARIVSIADPNIISQNRLA